MAELKDKHSIAFFAIEFNQLRPVSLMIGADSSGTRSSGEVKSFYARDHTQTIDAAGLAIAKRVRMNVFQGRQVIIQ